MNKTLKVVLVALALTGCCIGSFFFKCIDVVSELSYGGSDEED